MKLESGLAVAVTPSLGTSTYLGYSLKKKAKKNKRVGANIISFLNEETKREIK